MPRMCPSICAALLLASGIALSVWPAAAQKRRMPVLNAGDETIYDQTGPGRAGPFSQVTLRAVHSDEMDTSAVFTLRYDDVTHTRETDLYEYHDSGKDEDDSLFAGISTRLSEGSRIIHQYNAQGLPISIRTYNVAPAHTARALYDQLMMRIMQDEQEKYPDGNDEGAEKSEAELSTRRVRYRKMADSLRRIGIPELSVL